MARRFAKKSARRGTKKRTYKKKYVKGSKKIRGTTMNNTQFVKLKYTSTVDHLAATANEVVYRGNGPYDPEVAVGGNQPVGFDQWNAFYSAHRVRACKIKVTLTPSGTMPACQLVLQPNTVGTTTAANLLSQQKWAQSRFCGTGLNYPVTMKGYISTKKVFGMTEAAIQSDNFLGSAAGPPADQWYWQWRCDSLNGATAVDCYITAVLTYYIEFLNPKLLPQS